jgi:hypothetical protein
MNSFPTPQTWMQGHLVVKPCLRPPSYHLFFVAGTDPASPPLFPLKIDITKLLIFVESIDRDLLGLIMQFIAFSEAISTRHPSPPRSPLSRPPRRARAVTTSCLHPMTFQQCSSEARHCLTAVSHCLCRCVLQLLATSPLSVSPCRSPLAAPPPPRRLPPLSSRLYSEPVSPVVSLTCVGHRCDAAPDLPPPEPS